MGEGDLPRTLNKFQINLPIQGQPQLHNPRKITLPEQIVI